MPKELRVKREIKRMENYIEVIGDHLEFEKRLVRNGHGRKEKKEMEQGYIDFYDLLNDEQKEVEIEYPRILYISFVLIWYSIVENAMLRICKEYKMKTSEDFRDRGIYKAKKIYKRAMGYEIDKKPWDELIQIQKLRNDLVHKQGEVITYSKNPENIKLNHLNWRHVPLWVEMEENRFKYLKEYRLFLHRNGVYYLTPTKEYAEHLIKFAREFILKIYKDIDKLIT